MPLADRRGDRPLEGDLVSLDGRQRALRQYVVIALPQSGHARRQLHPFDGKPRGLHHPTGRGGDFRADPVAGNQYDRVFGHGCPFQRTICLLNRVEQLRWTTSSIRMRFRPNWPDNYDTHDDLSFLQIAPRQAQQVDWFPNAILFAAQNFLATGTIFDVVKT